MPMPPTSSSRCPLRCSSTRWRFPTGIRAPVNAVVQVATLAGHLPAHQGPRAVRQPELGSGPLCLRRGSLARVRGCAAAGPIRPRLPGLASAAPETDPSHRGLRGRSERRFPVRHPDPRARRFPCRPGQACARCSRRFSSESRAPASTSETSADPSATCNSSAALSGGTCRTSSICRQGTRTRTDAILCSTCCMATVAATRNGQHTASSTAPTA